MEADNLCLIPASKSANPVIGIMPLTLCLLVWAGCSNDEPAAKVSSSASVDMESRIKRLIKEIPDMPEPGHVGFTPAVAELADMGPCVLPYMLDVMSSDDYDFETQYGATIVLNDVIRDLCNAPPKNVVTAEEDARCRSLWLEMGDLYPDLPLEQRKKNVERWRAWLATRVDNIRD